MLRILPGTAYLTAFHLVEKGSKPASIELQSIGAPPDRAFPADVIVLPYGGKSREKIATRLAFACNSKQELYQIEVGVNIDRLIVKTLTLDSLCATSMMNIKRISKCIEATIIDYWCDYLEEEGKDIEWVLKHFGRDVQAYVSSRPDLIGRLTQEREFQHLNLIVFSLFGHGDSIDLGMILNRDAIAQKACKTDPNMRVIIPDMQ